MAQDAQARQASNKVGFTEGVARFIWGDLNAYLGKDGEIHQIERALGAIRGLAILGLVPVMLYGAVSSYCTGSACTPQWIWGDYLMVLRGMSVAALSAIAAFAAGGILGFLFGVPRWGEAPAGQAPAQPQPSAPAPAASPSATPPATIGQTAAPAALGEAGSQAALQAAKPQEGTTQPAPSSPATPTPAASSIAPTTGRVRPNTGLEKVMDWLTTLIVGLGLVHLSQAIEYMRKTSEWVTAAIAGNAGLTPPTNFAAGAAILIPYTIAGFLLVYLWAQRYMGREMALAEQESQLLQHMKEQAKVAAKEESARTRSDVARISETLFNLGPLAADSMVSISQRIEDSAAVSTEALAGVDPAIVDDIVKRYASARAYMDEPIRGFGQAYADGIRFDADIRRLSQGIALFEVTLIVSATVAEELTEPVVFLLHHTLPNPVRRVQPQNNVAKLSVLCAGSFFAGAVVVGTKTKLALDLAALPEVPQDFRDN